MVAPSNYTSTIAVPGNPRMMMPDNYEWTFYADAVMSYTSTVIIFMGIVTNLINIIVFQAQGLQDGVTLTLFTLSLSDFVMCVMLLGGAIVSMIRAVDPGHVLDPDSMFVACFGYSRSVAYCYSTCITVYVSLERSLCVVLPFKFKMIFTRKVTISVLLILAVSVVSLFIPTFATQGLSWRFDPRFNATRLLLWRKPNIRDIQLAFVISSSFIIPIVSQIMIGASTAVMIYGLRASSKFKETANTGTHVTKGETVSNKEIKAVKMVLYLSIVFFVCNAPLIITALAQIALPEFKIDGRLTQLYSTFLSIVLLISAVNGSVNFFIYHHHSSRFKEVFGKMFKKNAI